MVRSILLVLVGAVFCVVSGAYAQSVDTLNDDDIYAMKSSAERTLIDYFSAMRELVNPRISKIYRDRMISEFTTLGNRQIFLDSAYIVYDYDPDYQPPQPRKERPVLTYLNDFNVFYQGNDSQERLGVYYSLQRTHDIEADREGFYIILDFEIQYGDQLPLPRRATMRLVPRDDGWKALISYIKYNLETEDSAGEGPTAREALLPQWRILAEQADTLLQSGEPERAKVLLDSSFALNQESYSAQLLGQYYEQQDNPELAISYFEQSLALGRSSDPTYQDAEVEGKITQLQDRLDARREEERQAEVAAQPTPAAVTFENVSDTYRQGKEYTIEWNGASPQPLTLRLFRNDQLINTIQQNLVNNSLIWKVPKSVEKGDNYQFQLLNPEAEAGVKSGVFSIKKKTPLGIYIGTSVGVGAMLYFILRPNDDNGNGTENPVDPGLDQLLPEPPDSPN